MSQVNNRGLGGPRNTEPWTGDPLMPLTITIDIDAATPVVLDDNITDNWTQLTAANLPLLPNTLEVIGDRTAQPETKTPAPAGSVTATAGGLVVPQGVYLVELLANLHSPVPGSELKFAVTTVEASTSTHIYSWRSAQRQDDAGGFLGGTWRMACKLVAMLDTAEYIEGSVHDGKTRADVTHRSRRFGDSEELYFRAVNNEAAGTGAGTLALYEGSRLRLTRLCNSGGLAKADSDL